MRRFSLAKWALQLPKLEGGWIPALFPASCRMDAPARAENTKPPQIISCCLVCVMGLRGKVLVVGEL